MSNIRKKRMGKSSEARGARSIKEDVSGTQGEGGHSYSGATHKPETRDSRKAIPPAARTTSFDCPSHGYVKDGSRGTLCNVVQTSVSGMLFPQLSPRIVRGLDQEFLLALRRVWPLSRAHQATLPADISELSELLTISRADLRRPYWSAPALTSAYLYYFLPWNLVRLCRLFSGLELPAPRRGRPSILIDLGSGPLTVALALWFARPEWREMPVEVVAVDCAGRPPHLGRDILERLAAKAHCEPWIVHSVQAPLDQAARRVSSLLPAGQRPWLVTAANVLNELPAEKRRGFDSDDEDSDEFSEAEGGRLESLLSSLFPLLRPGTGDQIPQLLFVEPGTRLGGSTLMEMRSLALQAGLHVKAPCLHDFACPLKKSDSFEDGADGKIR